MEVAPGSFATSGCCVAQIQTRSWHPHPQMTLFLALSQAAAPLLRARLGVQGLEGVAAGRSTAWGHNRVALSSASPQAGGTVRPRPQLSVRMGWPNAGPGSGQDMCSSSGPGCHPLEKSEFSYP